MFRTTSAARDRRNAHAAIGVGRKATLVAIALASFAALVAPTDAPAALSGRFGPQSTDSAHIRGAAQARNALLRRGFRDITQLGSVGDYWEANARTHGKPVVVYLFDDGTLWVQSHPAMKVVTGGRYLPQHRAS